MDFNSTSAQPGRGAVWQFGVAGLVLLLATSAFADNAHLSRSIQPAARVARTSGAVPLLLPPRMTLDALVTPAIFTAEGPTFDSTRTAGGDQGWYWNVPEPVGAVGTAHLVSVSSGLISWYSKAGTLQNTQLLGKNRLGASAGSLFASLAPATEVTNARVVYDGYSGRFVVAAADWTSTANDPPDAANGSAILLAVSDDGDPNGTWYYYKINTALTVSGVSSFAGVPSVSVGPDGIFITSDFFAFARDPNTPFAYTGSRLIIVNKTPLYSGGAGTSSVYDPSALAGYTYVDGQGNTQVFEINGLTPVQMSGAAPAGVLTYLLSPGFYYSDPENYGEDVFLAIEVLGTLAAPTFPAVREVSLGGDISLDSDPSNPSLPLRLLAPQEGTTHTLDASGPPNAVCRNGQVWLTFTHAPTTGPDMGQPTIHWLHWDPAITDDTASVVAQGDVGGEDIAPGTATYYPSIAVNNMGSVAIGFEASGANLFPGAYYTGWLAAEPPGTLAPANALAAGVDYYYRVFGSPDPSVNALGPVSSTVVDPAGDLFWSFNGYALARGTILSGMPNEDGRWGTRWGAFKITGAAGDFNLDTFVDNADLVAFTNCFTGPSVPYTDALPPSCTGPAAADDAQGYIAADFDRDGDVDLADWGIMQKCFSGNAPAALNCGQ